MGRKVFISKNYYDKYQKFKCPLDMGFWHYSPNGCCLFINEKTRTIHHLYMRESCSLTRTGQTLQRLLLQKECVSAVADDDDTMDCDVDGNYPADCQRDSRFLDVLVQPFLGTTTVVPVFDQRIFAHMSYESRRKVLCYNDEITQQYWFVVCDLAIEYDVGVRNLSECYVQGLVLQNIRGPLVFCADSATLSAFLGTVTSRFVHEQMPILNNMSPDRLMRRINEIARLPAQDTAHCSPDEMFFMDARDLFDIVRMGSSEYITNMRTIHLTNMPNFLDSWRRVIFNFIQEMTNIHSFEKQTIRIRSTCNVTHFIRSSNRGLIPAEFRCSSETSVGCIHLATRRKEYALFQAQQGSNGDPQSCPEANMYTLALSEEGAICRHVLDAMIDEYGEGVVDRKFNFNCFFTNDVFEHCDTRLWQRVVCQTLGGDTKPVLRDGSSLPRERIACMQTLCRERRINDIHRFCLPKRFLNLGWFKWACNQLKLGVFDEEK